MGGQEGEGFERIVGEFSGRGQEQEHTMRIKFTRAVGVMKPRIISKRARYFPHHLLYLLRLPGAGDRHRCLFFM